MPYRRPKMPENRTQSRYFPSRPDGRHRPAEQRFAAAKWLARRAIDHVSLLPSQMRFPDLSRHVDYD
jgi:hypothetical protein